jgi:hypothetical protein
MLTQGQRRNVTFARRRPAAGEVNADEKDEAMAGPYGRTVRVVPTAAKCDRYATYDTWCRIHSPAAGDALSYMFGFSGAIRGCL